MDERPTIEIRGLPHSASVRRMHGRFFVTISPWHPNSSTPPRLVGIGNSVHSATRNLQVQVDATFEYLAGWASKQDDLNDYLPEHDGTR